MSSNYTIAFAGMPALLDEQEHVMENFTFERYPDSFKRYCNKHKATLKAVEDGYLQVIDKEQFLTNMAEELANSAEKRIAEEEKKNAKEKLDWQIHILQTQMAKNPEVEVVHFVPDPRKEGGRYERLKGVLQKVDLYKKEMVFSGNRIAMEHILELKSPLFEKTETEDW